MRTASVAAKSMAIPIVVKVAVQARHLLKLVVSVCGCSEYPSLGDIPGVIQSLSPSNQRQAAEELRLKLESNTKILRPVNFGIACVTERFTWTIAYTPNGTAPKFISMGRLLCKNGHHT